MAKFSSRMIHLGEELAQRHQHMALKAFNLIIQEMCAEKGYCRHSGIHYYYHPMDVASFLLDFDVEDEDIIAAALLHDIVEDVPAFTIDKIKALFNDRVADMVKRLTKPAAFNAQSDQHFEQYKQGIFKDLGASLIKTCDIINNHLTLENAPPEKRYRKALEIETHWIPFIKQCREEYPEHKRLFFRAKTIIEGFNYLLKEPYEHYEQLRQLEEELSLLKEKVSACHPKKPFNN